MGMKEDVAHCLQKEEQDRLQAEKTEDYYRRLFAKIPAFEVDIRCYKECKKL